jgi:phage terminase Nu1 subunit (DNA packaging protein)
VAEVSVTALARACHITPHRVQQLVAEGMPRTNGGKYDLGVCVSWYSRYLPDQVERRTPSVHATAEAEALRGERRRLIEAQADLKALELARERRQLLPIGVARKLVARSLFRLRSRLLNAPGKYARRLKVLNTKRMNQAVFAFRRYEDASRRYAGIESHEGLTHE